MGTARFRFKVQELDFKDWSARGGCRYELLYQPASESAFLPFAKIASGGELSRILLAIKTIPSTSEAAKPTIIFDEIDAGLGGVTANAVAKRLRALSQGHQVIAVTHLPQIAAVADKQYVVSKQADAQNLQVRVQSVVGEERVHEIARMLSGSADELALAHARQLLGLTEA
jgi:DNA repair protein RecN (Recombination protein N)